MSEVATPEGTAAAVPAAPVASAAPAAVVPPAVTPEAAAPAAPAEEKVTMSPAQLKARLAEEREKAEKRIAAELGVSVADAKAAMAKAKALEDEKLSETERLKNRNAELEKLIIEREAAARREGAKPYADAQMAALTEAQRAVVLGFAGDDPTAQIKAIAALSPTWAAAAQPAAPAAPPAPLAPPANTAPPAGAKPVPGSTTPIDHRAEYERRLTFDKTAARMYADAHPQVFSNVSRG